MPPDGGTAPGVTTASPAVELLHHLPYRTLWAAGALNSTVRWLDVLTVGVFTYQLTGSPLWVSVVLFLRMLPMFLFGAAIGAVADVVNKRRLLLTGTFAMAGIYGVLGLLTFLGELGPMQIAIGSFISGLFWVMELPVRRTMVMEAVGVTRIGAAMGFESSTQSLTRAFGPIAGGVLLDLVGMHGAYWLGAMLSLGANFFIFMSAKSDAPTEPLPRSSFVSTMREGFRYIRQDRVVQAVLLCTIALNFFGFAYVSMLPVIGESELGLSAFLIGTLMSAEGAASFFGALLIAFRGATRHFNRIFLFGSIAYLFGVLFFSLSTSYWAAIAVLLAGGFGMSGFTTMQSTIILAQTPGPLRNRVLGVMAFCIGFAPFGVLNVGFIATHIGPRNAVTLIAVLGLVCVALAAFLRPEIFRGKSLSS